MADRATAHWAIREAGAGDAEIIGRLLHDFNREFHEPTPDALRLAGRVRQLLTAGDTVILLKGSGPRGLAVLRFRPAIWSGGLECTLAELFVVPDQRGHGLGRALLEAAVQVSHRRGADRMEVATGNTNVVARALYESVGFTNGDGTSSHYLYQLELT